MADITRWDPFGEMLSLRQAMDRLMEEAFVRPRGLTSLQRAGGPTGLELDLYEEGDDLVVTAPLPGVKPEDVDVSVQGNVLTIQGETRAEDESTRGRYHHRERHFGSFYRQVELPSPIQVESAQASFENGVLRLRLPKAEEGRERRIPITGGARAAATRDIGTSAERGGGESRGDSSGTEGDGGSSQRRGKEGGTSA